MLLSWGIDRLFKMLIKMNGCPPDKIYAIYMYKQLSTIFHMLYYCNWNLSPSKYNVYTIDCYYIRNKTLFILYTNCSKLRSNNLITTYNSVLSNLDYSCTYIYAKFVSDLRQIGGFLRVLWFPPPIKLTATI